MAKVDWFKHVLPLKLKDGRRHVFPTLASLVYFDDNTTLEDKAFGGSDPNADQYMLKTDTAADSAKLGGKLPEYYKNNLVVLWSNPNTSSTFAKQSVVLSDAVENFTLLIIECVRSNTNGAKIAGIFVCDGVSKNYIVFDEYFYRYADNIGGTNVTFNDSYSADSGDNNRIIPSRIYGLKLGGV